MTQQHLSPSRKCKLKFQIQKDNPAQQIYMFLQSLLIFAFLAVLYLFRPCLKSRLSAHFQMYLLRHLLSYLAVRENLFVSYVRNYLFEFNLCFPLGRQLFRLALNQINLVEFKHFFLKLNFGLVSPVVLASST